MDVFDRAAAAAGQLLKVDWLPSAGEAAAAFVLTFDVGHVLVRADPLQRCLAASHLADFAEVAETAVGASEEEPWWRLLGCRLLSASADPDAARVVLRFEIAGAEPRSVALALFRDGVRATLVAGH